MSKQCTLAVVFWTKPSFHLFLSTGPCFRDNNLSPESKVSDIFWTENRVVPVIPCDGEHFRSFKPCICQFHIILFSVFWVFSKNRKNIDIFCYLLVKKVHLVLRTAWFRKSCKTINTENTVLYRRCSEQRGLENRLKLSTQNYCNISLDSSTKKASYY